MVPCCPCVSVRRNQGRLTKSLNEGTHLFLRQNAVESLYKVAHGSLVVASYHIIDSLDMTDVVSLAGSPNMGLISVIGTGTCGFSHACHGNSAMTTKHGNENLGPLFWWAHFLFKDTVTSCSTIIVPFTN